MISTATIIFFFCMLAALIAFLIWSLRGDKQELHLLHKLYIAMAVCYAIWMLPLIGIYFSDPDNQALMFFWDCAMQPGGVLLSPIFLCIAITLDGSLEKMSGKMKALFIVPTATILITWTNPLHHLQYRVFSVVRSEIVFGPWILVSGAYNYLCLLAAIVIIIRFALKNRSSIYLKQSILLTIGGLVPLIVNFYATFSGKEVSIAATPTGFAPTIICNGIAIYMLHLFDIRPIANRHILDWISDGYLVVSDTGLVINYNKSFASLFASQYGIAENRYLSDCVREEDISKKTAIYNMLTAIESSRQAESTISYEQSVSIQNGNEVQKYYYVTDVSPLELNGKVAGFVVLFKDVTQIKKSMQQIQESQERMMEQERLAVLGQMIGGLAHNLKTPVMSVSGCISAVEALVDECSESLGDPQVTEADFREIYGEMKDWFQKMREASSYMSDIITAIKGQAANVNTDEESVFTIEEMIKRCALLMRHEFLRGGCQMEVRYDLSRDIALKGDINNLIQVLTNLLSNAVYAQHEAGGGKIVVQIGYDKENLNISVKDHGSGISPAVRGRLFKSMVTNKGALGTGLGLYISNAVIRGKFGGTMWFEDNEGGGSIFGISIPLSLAIIGEEAEHSAGYDQ